MKAAIHALKYDRLHPAARGLGRMLALAIAQLADEAPGEMLVVPVPLHRSKYADRGFNQARSLAVAALEALRKSHPEWRLTLASSTLMRLRATSSQAGLTPRQRRLNVRGAFTVSDLAAVDSKHILLIDDILTTGATARAASLALTRAGAASVWVATLARAGRIYNRRGSSVRFNDAEEIPVVEDFHRSGNSEITLSHPSRNNKNAARVGHSPAANLQGAFQHSSHDQPSF
jgi:ComF family protein